MQQKAGFGAHAQCKAMCWDSIFLSTLSKCDKWPNARSLVAVPDRYRSISGNYGNVYGAFTNHSPVSLHMLRADTRIHQLGIRQVRITGMWVLAIAAALIKDSMYR